MAYQNVGTPRFIIDWLQWWKSLGLIRGHDIFWGDSDSHETESAAVDNLIGLDPTSQTIVNNIQYPDNNPAHGFNYRIFEEKQFPYNQMNIVGLLGHNLADFALPWETYQGAIFTYSYQTEISGDVWDSGHVYLTNDILINCKPETNQYIKPIYNGFSFRSADGSSSSKNSITGANSMLPNIRGINPDISNIGFKLGSLLLGRYYNVPNNPELNLTMTTEMDGISAIKTKGGTDLMDAEYLRSPDWGNLPAWELSNNINLEKNQLSKIGRRIWNLNFNYLSDKQLFPEISGSSNYGAFQPSGITDTGQEYNEGSPYFDSQLTGSSINYAFLNAAGNSNFYSEVIHPTNGGVLPFIFQPDSNNNNPDQFAICKLDMNNFNIKQIAKNIYNISIIIKEIW